MHTVIITQELEAGLTISVHFHTGRSEWIQVSVCLTFQTGSRGSPHLIKENTDIVRKPTQSTITKLNINLKRFLW